MISDFLVLSRQWAYIPGHGQWTTPLPQVSKYNCCTNKPAWLPHLSITTAASDCQTANGQTKQQLAVEEKNWENEDFKTKVENATKNGKCHHPPLAVWFLHRYQIILLDDEKWTTCPRLLRSSIFPTYDLLITSHRSHHCINTWAALPWELGTCPPLLEAKATGGHNLGIIHISYINY